MASKRAIPLSAIEQRQFVNTAIPGRIRLIRDHLNEPSYSAMTVVAVTVRALASFLGIGRHRNGQLFMATDYYEHAPGLSYEVKISDLPGGQLIDPKKLPPEVQKIISDGILEANVGFAHFTFWSSLKDQSSSASATDNYLKEQFDRLRNFADAIITLWESSAKSINI